MSDDTKHDKTRRVSAKRKIRATQVLEGVMQNKTTEEIGKDLGLSRSAVSEILNSEETREIVEKLESRVTKMAEKVIERFESIASRGSDDDVIKIGLPILRTRGVINEKREVELKFPRPTVIQYKGKRVILGTEGDEDDED